MDGLLQDDTIRRKLWREQYSVCRRLPKLKKLYQEMRYYERALAKDPENPMLLINLNAAQSRFNIYLQDTNLRYQHVMEQHCLSCQLNKKEYDDPFRKVDLNSWHVEPE